MKRFFAATAVLVLVSQANAFVPPLAPFAIGIGLGALLTKIVPRPDVPTTIVTAAGGEEGFNYEGIYHIAIFPNGELYASERPKLQVLRDVIEEQFGANTRLADIGGMQDVLNYKWASIDLKKPYKNTAQTLGMTVSEFFGTADAPNFANLAVVTARVPQLCTHHRATCEAAGGMLQIFPAQ